MTTYFTYLLGWTVLNKQYYGVRYCKNCDPSSLWTTYFSSSKTVQWYRKKHGEPNIVEVRRTFTDKRKATLWEQKVLKRMNVPHNENMLNKNVGGYRGEGKLGAKSMQNNSFKINNPMKNPASVAKLVATRKRKNLGKQSAKYLKPRYGDANAMRQPELLEKYKERIRGRKRQYREDGTWHWSYNQKSEG